MAGVTRHQLSNGLTVLLKEQHSSPVVSWWVMYRIGSRNERTGQTGISHWVEHMMFKGTPTFPGGILDRQISREGGNWNAQTSMERVGLAPNLAGTAQDAAQEKRTPLNCRRRLPVQEAKRQAEQAHGDRLPHDDHFGPVEFRQRLGQEERRGEDRRRREHDEHVGSAAARKFRRNDDQHPVVFLAGTELPVFEHP